MENDTVWLTQAQMAELFQKDRTVITRHINNAFKEGELNREEVCAKIAHTTRHGAMKGKTQVQEVVFYNLDVIISVGYRVKATRIFCVLLIRISPWHFIHSMSLSPWAIALRVYAVCNSVDGVRFATSTLTTLTVDS